MREQFFEEDLARIRKEIEVDPHSDHALNLTAFELLSERTFFRTVTEEVIFLILH